MICPAAESVLLRLIGGSMLMWILDSRAKAEHMQSEHKQGRDKANKIQAQRLCLKGVLHPPPPLGDDFQF